VMEPMGDCLSRSGCTVVNIGYPSTEADVEHLSKGVAEQIRQHCPDTTRRLHFVTHSLGGILVRSLEANGPLPYRPGRVVMLGPPNTGTELATVFGDSPILSVIMGTRYRELGVEPSSTVNRLPSPRSETGVIAGRCSCRPLESLVLPGSDDGIVTVARTRLPVCATTGCFLVRTRSCRSAGRWSVRRRCSSGLDGSGRAQAESRPAP
jgi:triacylglycerol lipase